VHRYPLISDVHDQFIRTLEQEERAGGDKEIKEKKKIINLQLEQVEKKM